MELNNMDGLYKGTEQIQGDLPLMVLDDLSEMFGVQQLDYMMMDGSTDMPMGIRPRDEKGHSIKVVR